MKFAKTYSTVIGDRGYLVAICLAVTTIAIKDFTSEWMGVDRYPSIKKIYDKEGALGLINRPVKYMVGTAVVLGLGFALPWMGLFAPSVTAVMGTALAVHLIFTVYKRNEKMVNNFAKGAVEGVVVGTVIVFGNNLLGRVTSLAPLTYSAGAGIGALTLGVKWVVEALCEGIIPMPGAQ